MPPSKQYQSESSRQPIWDKILRLVPHIKTELNYTTHFQLLIAVILSAQTTDRQVNNVTKKLFRNVTEAVDILNLGLKKLTLSLSGINYFRTKAKHIFATAQMLRDNFGGVIPNDEKLLMKLPWVGIKTAKVVRSVLFDAASIGVDTHVHRVLNRIGIVKTTTPEKTDKIVESIFSTREKKVLHHALVLFGRYTCTARSPKCNICPITEKCRFFAIKNTKHN